MAEANRRIGATDAAWAALLLTPNVEPMDLTLAGALAASRTGPDLGVGHCSFEATVTNATIVTSQPEVYDPTLPIARFCGA